MIRHTLALCLALLCTTSSLRAADSISVVSGSKAGSLEHDAARELARQWKQMFGVDAELSHDTIPATTNLTVLVGSPTTNPAIAKSLGGLWPKICSSVGPCGGSIFSSTSSPKALLSKCAPELLTSMTSSTTVSASGS